MAEKSSWQSQSFAKNASTGPSTMSSKIAGNQIHSMHSKIGRPTVHNYADGGEVNANPFQGDDVDPFSAVRDPETGSTAPQVAVDDTYNEDVKQDPKPEAKAKSFKEAFAENRKAGNSTFEWGGKKFTTEMATSKPAPRAAQKQFAKPTKTFSEDVAERKQGMSVEKSVERAMARDENYGNEGRRSVMSKSSGGRGVIDTTNIDSKTLLPKR